LCFVLSSLADFFSSEKKNGRVEPSNLLSFPTSWNSMEDIGK
jgi:hypothetical protein